jgi:hypothetical protein
MEIALDAINKLVAYDYLRGSSSVASLSGGQGSVRRANSSADADNADDDSSAVGGTLMDLIIRTVCNCIEQPEDGVQLQVRIWAIRPLIVSGMWTSV